MKRQITVNGEDVTAIDEFGEVIEEEEFDEIHVVAYCTLTVKCKRSFDLDRVISKVSKVDDRLVSVVLDDWQEIGE